MSFQESVGFVQGQDNDSEKFQIISDKKMITFGDLLSEVDVKKATLSDWVKQNVAKGLLIWCDENGNPVADNILKKLKSSGKAFIRLVESAGLPSPYELTGDIAWAEGGEQYEIYNLHLEASRSCSEFGDLCVPELGSEEVTSTNFDNPHEPAYIADFENFLEARQAIEVKGILNPVQLPSRLKKLLEKQKGGYFITLN